MMGGMIGMDHTNISSTEILYIAAIFPISHGYTTLIPEGD